jgi:hypothetical protein
MARTNEALWKRIVASVKRGSKGGKAGQWSARKAQLATQRYKKAVVILAVRLKPKSLYLSGLKRIGELSLVSLALRVRRLRVSVTCLRRHERLCPKRNMPLRHVRNVLTPKQVNNLVNNLKRLQRKQQDIENSS